MEHHLVSIRPEYRQILLTCDINANSGITFDERTRNRLGFYLAGHIAGTNRFAPHRIWRHWYSKSASEQTRYENQNEGLAHSELPYNG